MITIRGKNAVYFPEDAYSKKVLLDGKTCVIEVLDTAEAVSVIKLGMQTKDFQSTRKIRLTENKHLLCKSVNNTSV